MVEKQLIQRHDFDESNHLSHDLINFTNTYQKIYWIHCGNTSTKDQHYNAAPSIPLLTCINIKPLIIPELFVLVV